MRTTKVKHNPFAEEDEQFDRENIQSMLESKAVFCLGTGVAPSEYDQMTIAEVDAFLKIAKKNHK